MDRDYPQIILSLAREHSGQVVENVNNAHDTDWIVVVAVYRDDDLANRPARNFVFAEVEDARSFFRTITSFYDATEPLAPWKLAETKIFDAYQLYGSDDNASGGPAPAQPAIETGKK